MGSLPCFVSGRGGYENYDSGYTGGCYGRPAGYYGDASYDCKTFQVCQSDGRLDTMYCPPYTRFNNYLGVCDWHFKVRYYIIDLTLILALLAHTINMTPLIWRK